MNLCVALSAKQKENWKQKDENEIGYILIGDGKIQHNVLAASPFSQKEQKVKNK